MNAQLVVLNADSFFKLQQASPGHHLLLFIGGVAAAADWPNGGGQEVEPMVFEVLVHQRQHDLEKSAIITLSVSEFNS